MSGSNRIHRTGESVLNQSVNYIKSAEQNNRAQSHSTIFAATYSMALRSMSTSSPVQSGIFFFFCRRLFEWQTMSALEWVPSICKICLKVPSNSCKATVRGPTYFRTPNCCVHSCFSSNSTVFLKTRPTSKLRQGFTHAIPEYLNTNLCWYCMRVIPQTKTYLFRLNTNAMWNLTWPPWRTHWSMKTVMSFPVTVKTERVKEAVLMSIGLVGFAPGARE